ncbi:MAG: apolipoprotein N-acyltransferase [Gammaproteobacteria bacterium]|nr:apolipoprotein N-acyltransferase [Gammaproteobacteria bacterium]
MTSVLPAFVATRPRVADAMALVAGALYPLAFSPFGLWPFAFVALVVLVVVTTDENVSVRRGSGRFFLFALGVYGVGTSWIYVSIHDHGNASPLLASLLVAAFVLGLSLLSWIHGWLFLRFVRPLPSGVAFGFALTWLLREWGLTWILTGFPWLLVGYGFLDTALAGYVPVVGVLGLGFLVALQSSLVARVIGAPSRRLAGAAAAIIVLVWFGGFALRHVGFVERTGAPISVAAVQGNIDQRVKWRRDMIGPIIDTHLSLTNEVWDSDLIVWPEASITLFRESAESLLNVLDRRASQAGAALILGIPDRGNEGQFFNTAIALGTGEGQYIKRRLVPFGEYVPLEGLLRGTIDFFDLPMSRNRPGPRVQEQLLVDGMRVGVSICYEIVYPELVRAPTVGPDLLVTISNDTWFGNSIGPWQHMEMARARALENGRYLIRGTNNGITAIVDPNGRIAHRLPASRRACWRARYTGSRAARHTG